MTFSPSISPLSRKPPNLFFGFMLNVLLPGAGFTYINQPWWHLRWLLIFVFSFIAGKLTGTSVLALTFALFIMFCIQLHYFLSYRSHFKDGQLPEALPNITKLLLISLHVLPSLWSLNLTSKMVHNIPAETRRMQEIGINSYMREVQTMLNFSGKSSYEGPCTDVLNVGAPPRSVQSCTVTSIRFQTTIHIVKTDGQVIDYP